MNLICPSHLSQIFDFYISAVDSAATNRLTLEKLGLSDSFAYAQLKKFNGVLRKLSTALRKMVDDPDADPLASLFGDMAAEFYDGFRRVSY